MEREPLLNPRERPVDPFPCVVEPFVKVPPVFPLEREPLPLLKFPFMERELLKRPLVPLPPGLIEVFAERTPLRLST